MVRSYKDEVTCIRIRKDGVEVFTECEVYKNGEYEKRLNELFWERRKNKLNKQKGDKNYEEHY